MHRVHPPRPAQRPPRAARGLTLIEMMIAVVVVAVLAALAYPPFVDAVRKGRRGDAFAALTNVQQAQERWRASKAGYAQSLALLELPATTASGHYTISIDSATASGYVIRAQAIGPQAQDKACATMAVQASGGSILYGSACQGCTLALPLVDSARCWSRQ